MTSSSTIATQFNTELFGDADLTTITTKVLFHPHTLVSESEIDDLYYGQEVNFFECLITRSEQSLITGPIRYTYDLTINYYREVDTDGDNWRATRDAMETLLSNIRTNLGVTWDGLVDFATPQEDAPAIESVDIAGTPAWKTSFKFTAVKTT